MSQSIEEAHFSMGLYNKLKRAGINTTDRIHRFDYKKLTKGELIEVLNMHDSSKQDK